MPTVKPNVFISFAHEDASLAKYIASMLEHSGVETWRDEATVRVGANWHEELAQQLEKANLYVLLVTPNYLQSNWSNFEAGVALSRAASSEDVTVLPLTFGVERNDLPPLLRSFKTLSLDQNPNDVQQALESALHMKTF
jgi:TIR domain